MVEQALSGATPQVQGWVYAMRATGNVGIEGIGAASNGVVLAATVEGALDAAPPSPRTKSDHRIATASLDELGRQRWLHTLNAVNDDGFGGVQATSAVSVGDDLVVTGFRKGALSIDGVPGDISPKGDEMSGYLLRFDRNGGLVWSRPLPGESGGGESLSVHNDELAVSAWTRSEVLLPGAAAKCDARASLVTRLQGDGRPVWSRCSVKSPDGSTRTEGVTILASGEVAVCGRVRGEHRVTFGRARVGPDFVENKAEQSQVYVAMFDKDGAVEWLMAPDPRDGTQCSGLVARDDGTVLMGVQEVMGHLDGVIYALRDGKVVWKKVWKELFPGEEIVGGPYEMAIDGDDLWAVGTVTKDGMLVQLDAESASLKRPPMNLGGITPLHVAIGTKQIYVAGDKRAHPVLGQTIKDSDAWVGLVLGIPRP